MAYPDLVELLRPYLLPILVTPVASEVPDPRPDKWTQLRDVGGTQVRPVRDQQRLDVFSWALTEIDARDLADLTRRSIHALKGTVLSTTVVYRIEETMRPRPNKDPLTGRPRYWATYSILVRADDAV